MKQVILKHKSGETSGPHERTEDSVKIGSTSVPIITLQALGFVLEDHVKPRREWWVFWDGDVAERSPCIGRKKSVMPWENMVKVTEIREGELVLSREDVVKALNELYIYHDTIDGELDMLKALGFEEQL